jgi:two-component system osmolarity sensor histidine kinase EnvZ
MLAGQGTTARHPSLMTVPAPAASWRSPARPCGRISLFWRTFFLLGALLLVGSIAGLAADPARAGVRAPRVQTAQQIASLVNLSRAALIHADAIARVSLIKTMTEQEGCASSARARRPSRALWHRRRWANASPRNWWPAGPGHRGGQQVNGKPGLWVGFTIDGGRLLDAD